MKIHTYMHTYIHVKIRKDVLKCRCSKKEKNGGPTETRTHLPDLMQWRHAHAYPVYCNPVKKGLRVQSFAIPKVPHLLRTSPAWKASEELANFDRTVHQALQNICNIYPTR